MTSELAKGNFTSRLNISTKNELGGLSRSLNELGFQFQQRLLEITNDKDRLKAILSSMVEGVLVVNADGRLQHISPNFRQMLELRSPEAHNKLYWEIIWNQEINNTIKEALNNKQALRKEIQILGSNEVFVSMQISPVLDSAKNLISLVAVFHDITELKKLEKMRSEFVANVSHELKTPLTAIKGFVETLQSGAKDDPRAVERFLDIIAKQTERLENLVNDLLILSSIESKEVRFDIKPHDLQGIIDTVLQIQKNQIDRLGHHVKIDLPNNLPKILVDRLRIEQVFINLIDNAVKFTPNGGAITIIARQQQDFIQVDVVDSGIGIAAEHLSRLVERFYRVDKARAKETGGTGLGLSIVKHIVNAHQGKLSISSVPHKGSTFSVFLPTVSN
jgi:two-component system phosphate regulon sensor histidine kinase PhoR